MGTVREPLPEPGADSGLPQEVALMWERKLKKPNHFDNTNCFDLLFCFEALVFRQYET